MYEIKRPTKVCLCKNVSKDQIIASVFRGNVTFEAVSADTQASTGCGTCKKKVQAIIESTLILMKKEQNIKL
jgi:NAD(P)H-nitrite reductase large subunit